jgi:UDP-N-acetylglucosamine--N-acetylmuramyl-(pentapeptide) pyrophosphoryl-undecaprenol N-acetylglucosamine transferase
MSVFDTKILFYIHHHGKGHLARCEKLIPIIESLTSIELLTADSDFLIEIKRSFPHLPIHLLPSKWEGVKDTSKRTFDQAFEGVPFSKGATKRASFFHHLIVDRNITGFVSDVSAELTIYARGAGLNVLMQRHTGDISCDPTQVFAYQCANALYAPYPELFESGDFPFKDKTSFLGMLANRVVPTSENQPGITLIHDDKDVIAKVCKQLSHFSQPVTVIGGYQPTSSYPSNVKHIGHVDDLSANVKTEIVICSGGNNTVCELLSAMKKLIIIPQERPYHEQFSKAANLDNIGAAVMLDPALLDDEQSVMRSIKKADALSLSTLQSFYNEVANSHWYSAFEKLVKEQLICPSR